MAIKQNVEAIYKGKKIIVQFDFCPNYEYYLGCYNENGIAHYISPECLEGKEDEVIK